MGNMILKDFETLLLAYDYTATKVSGDKNTAYKSGKKVEDKKWIPTPSSKSKNFTKQPVMCPQGHSYVQVSLAFIVGEDPSQPHGEPKRTAEVQRQLGR